MHIMRIHILVFRSRPTLMLRRENDNVFTSLATFTKLCRGESPFSSNCIQPDFDHTTKKISTTKSTTKSATSTTSTTTTTTTTYTTTTTTTSTSTPTTTTVPGPYNTWYYKDITDFQHGPFSSSLMLQWDNAGYFR